MALADLQARLKAHIASEGTLLPAQEEAVFSDAALTLVGAGAGTGKTHTLSWRFIGALLREDTRPRDILTLTFTDKAANEMRERIGELFTSLRPVLDPGGNELDSVAAELQEAQISTIHAFALNIVREEALFLPSGLGARPVSPPEAELFVTRAEKALDTLDFGWFTRSLPQGTNSGDFLDRTAEEYLADAVTEYSPEATVSFALSLADLLESRGESPQKLLKRADDPHYFDAVKERIRDICLPLCREVSGAWAEVFAQLPSALPGKSAFNERLDALRKDWPADRSAAGRAGGASRLRDTALRQHPRQSQGCDDEPEREAGSGGARLLLRGTPGALRHALDRTALPVAGTA